MRNYNPKTLSVIIPANNEELNILKLAREIDLTMKSTHLEWECIWIDDGSTDDTWSEINKLKKPHRGLSLSMKSGQSNAMMAGVDASTSDLIAFLP